jgi:hypothetical protein
MPSRRRHGWPSHRRGGRWTETGQWVASQLATEARWHGELGGDRDESARTLKRRELGGGSWWTDGSAGDEGEALLVPSGGWGRMGSELRINDGRGSG